MSVFKVMQGTFGVDGLEHKWKVFHADTAEACWLHIYNAVMDASGPCAKLSRWEALTSWVEIHNGVENDYDQVMIKFPYPHGATADVPDWIKDLMGRPQTYYDGETALRETHEATLAKHLTHQLSLLAA